MAGDKAEQAHVLRADVRSPAGSFVGLRDAPTAGRGLQLSQLTGTA